MTRRTWPWYLPMIVGVLLAASLISFVRWRFPAPEPAAVPSTVWVEVSRGDFVRAVKHVPTGRCYVRYSEGGIVETSPEVCQ